MVKTPIFQGARMLFFDLFKPKWKHSNPGVRFEAIASLKRASVLKRVANNDVNSAVRQCTIQNITDEALLADIAVHSYFVDTQIHAVTRLTNQLLLANIAKTHEDAPVRGLAVKKVTDQVLLADIAKTHEDAPIRKLAVEKVTDQVLLANIAKTDENSSVRRLAVEKITDQVLLADIAKTHEDAPIRKLAVEKVTDQVLLADISKTHEDAPIRKLAVEKVTDQVLLADISKTHEDAPIRKLAVEKVTDQALLADITKTDESDGVRWCAVEKMTDQTLLTDIARKNNYYFYIREHAINRLTDQTLLADLVKNDNNFIARHKALDVQLRALEQINEESVLTQLAIQLDDLTVGKRIITKLTDRKSLAVIIQHCKNTYMKAFAREKVAVLGKFRSQHEIQQYIENIEKLVTTERGISRTAAETLYSIGEPFGLQIIQAFEGNQDALAKLESSKELRAIEPLCNIWRITHYRNKDNIRKVARKILAQIGDPALPSLIEVLKDVLTRTAWTEFDIRVEEVCMDVGAILKKIGGPAVEPLVKLLGEVDSRNSGDAIASILAQIGKPAVDPLIHALNRMYQVEFIAIALRELSDKRAVEPLKAALGRLGYKASEFDFEAGHCWDLNQVAREKVLEALLKLGENVDINAYKINYQRGTELGPVVVSPDHLPPSLRKLETRK